MSYKVIIKSIEINMNEIYISIMTMSTIVNFTFVLLTHVTWKRITEDYVPSVCTEII